jgi:hypothetical protein
MNTIVNSQNECWALCHNNIDIFHVVQVFVGNTLETEQPYLEKFSTEEETKNRILEINPNYTEEDGTHS